MKQTINFHDFVDAFNRMGRSEQFSYRALKALFEYLEDIFDGDYELDVIALCSMPVKTRWLSYSSKATRYASAGGGLIYLIKPAKDT